MKPLTPDQQKLLAAAKRKETKFVTARQERDEAILQAARAGIVVREISKVLDLSPARIAAIVNEKGGRA